MTNAAAAPGAISGLLGNCAAAASLGGMYRCALESGPARCSTSSGLTLVANLSAPGAAENVRCDAQMATAYPTCPAYQSCSVQVARYPAIELYLGDVSQTSFQSSNMLTPDGFGTVCRRTRASRCRIRG